MNALDIRNIRKELGKTQVEFAKLLGVSKNSVQLWETEKRNPSPSMVFLIKETYKKHTNNEKEGVIKNTNGNKFIKLPNGKYRMQAPKVPFKAYASFIEIFDDEYQLNERFETTYFTVDKTGRGKYIAFVTQNESMNGGGIDDTPSGAEVLAREIGKHLWQDGFHNCEYGFIIVAQSGIFHKDIKDNDTKGKIICYSRNKSPEHQPFELTLDEVHSIWKVIKRTF